MEKGLSELIGGLTSTAVGETTFQIGDVVTWCDREEAERHRELGEGPFRIVAVEEVPLGFYRAAVGHHQWLRVTSHGDKSTPPSSKISGSFFKRID